MSQHSHDQHRYCVILAGGDGMRLRPLTRCVSTDERPKQFCPFLFGWTPLHATRRRAAHKFTPERTLFVVTRGHERFYTSELADVGEQQILIQPCNQGTASAILLSLLHLNRLDSEASVVFLPSDHHYHDESRFLEGVECAFRAAEGQMRPAILLGASPTHAEVGYGWIEPGSPLEAEERGRLFRVKRFWEKPSRPVARVLFNLGCLWNTFVMVGRVRTLLNLIHTAAPRLHATFQSHEASRGAFDCGELYETLKPVDFSREILVQSASQLAVMDIGPAGWSDLGEPERVVRLVSQLDSHCDWLAAWRRSGSNAAC